MDARILYETPDRSMTLATHGSLFVTIHRRDYTAEEIAALQHHQLSFARERGAPFPLLTILDVTERHIVRFSGPAREATLELARAMAPHTCCSGVVFDRGGFAASAIRSLITTVNVLSKQPFPTRVFVDLEEAIGWLDAKLDKRSGSDFDPVAILAAIKRLRAVEGPAHP